MPLCALCGLSSSSSDSLCPYHAMNSNEWDHEMNRAMCDFLHRGIVCSAEYRGQKRAGPD